MLKRNPSVIALACLLLGYRLLPACGDLRDPVVDGPPGAGASNAGSGGIETGGTSGVAGASHRAGTSSSDAGAAGDGEGGTNLGGSTAGGGGISGASGSGGAGTGGAGAGGGGESGTGGSGGASGGGTSGGGTSGGGAGGGGTSGAGGGGETGGSGGLSGSANGGGGGASGPVCGNHVKESGELCDPPFSENNCGGLHLGAKPNATAGCSEIESGVCLACIIAAGVDSFDCAGLTGNAAAGPGSGRPKKTLCYELLDCMYDTRCAAVDPVDCYCGTNGTTCPAGAGNGLCRAEVEASLETTAFAEIGSRIGDPTWAGGVAVVRLDASREMCGATCGSL